jgi:hypothetical protein
MPADSGEEDMKHLIAVTVAALVAACAAAPVEAPPRDIAWEPVPVLKVATGSIDVLSEAAVPAVAAALPIAPEAMVRSWAKNRLVPEGDSRRTRVLLRRIAASTTEMPRVSGFDGIYGSSRFERFDLELEVSVEVLRDDGFRAAYATASAADSRTLKIGAPLAARDRTLHELEQSVGARLDAALVDAMRRHLADDLR